MNGSSELSANDLFVFVRSFEITFSHLQLWESLPISHAGCTPPDAHEWALQTEQNIILLHFLLVHIGATCTLELEEDGNMLGNRWLAILSGSLQKMYRALSLNMFRGLNNARKGHTS